MILEGQSDTTDQNINRSNYSQKYSDLNDKNNQESYINRLREDFHKKIRIRDLEKIKAQKRKVFLIDFTIQEILNSSFPKQSDEAKNWASNLAQLFYSSKKYQTDPHKLREIFLLAEKFPSLGTLKLLYLAIMSTNAQNVRTLFDLDIWRFLHNILLFPNLNSKQKSPNKQDNPCSPSSSKSINALFVEIQMIKAAIETFICLFKKDTGFRDYSIVSHQSFCYYLKPAYKKYNESIKTQVLYFFKQVFAICPQSYSKQYLFIVKEVIKIFLDYKDKFVLFFNRRQWIEEEIKETVQDTIKRSSIVVAVLCKVFTYTNKVWLFQFVQNFLISKDYNYLQILDLYISFGQSVLESLVKNSQEISKNPQLFESTIEFLYVCFGFYSVYVEKSTDDDNQSYNAVPKIVKKSVTILALIKKSGQNKIFNEIQRQLMVDVQRIKQRCLFMIEFSLNSEFDTYERFFKHFIFFEGKNGQNVNLLTLVQYFLNTEYDPHIMNDLINVIFALFKMKVKAQQINKFMPMRQIMEKICDMLADQMVIQNIKYSICGHFFNFVENTSQKLGEYLRIEDIFLKNLHKITGFMYSNRCSQSLYSTLQNLVRIVKINNDNSTPQYY